VDGDPYGAAEKALGVAVKPEECRGRHAPVWSEADNAFRCGACKCLLDMIRRAEEQASAMPKIDLSSLLPPRVKYPEHKKLRAIVDKSQSIGDFIDWLKNEKSVLLMREDSYEDEEGQARDFGYAYVGGELRTYLEEFFEIDGKKLEAEKRAMLEEQRKLNGHESDGDKATEGRGESVSVPKAP
jgi:hypothetical protein